MKRRIKAPKTAIIREDKSKPKAPIPNNTLANNPPKTAPKMPKITVLIFSPFIGSGNKKLATSPISNPKITHETTLIKENGVVITGIQENAINRRWNINKIWVRIGKEDFRRILFRIN